MENNDFNHLQILEVFCLLNVQGSWLLVFSIYSHAPQHLQAIHTPLSKEQEL